MVRLSIRTISPVFWMILVQAIVVFSCPANCRCRGKATKCGSGFSSFPVGLDATTEFLGISGSASQRNNFSLIRQADFSGLRLLFSLEITFSGIEHVEDQAFSNLQSLSVLNLANNDIKELSTNTFKGLTPLTSLDLSGNKNCGFNNTIFTYIGNIEYLNLGDMNLMFLPKELFKFVPKLKRLRLYMNGISTVPTQILSPLADLQYLDVSSNQLSELQVELKPYFTQIQHLNLAENPWQCNCKLLWLRDIPGHVLSSVTDAKEVVCNGPATLKYASFSTIPVDKFHCIPINIRGCDNVSQSLELMESVVLPCSFEGDPKPEIKWVRPDGFEIVGRGTVNGSYELLVNGTLLIRHVTQIDHGEWIVSVYNQTTRVDKRIQINVTSLPSTVVYSTLASTSGNSLTSEGSTPTLTTKSSTVFKRLSSESPTPAISRTAYTFATDGSKSSGTTISCHVYFLIMMTVLFGTGLE